MYYEKRGNTTEDPSVQEWAEIWNWSKVTQFAFLKRQKYGNKVRTFVK